MPNQSLPRSRPWDGIITAQDLLVYEKAGFGRKGGLGKSPAILIIDVQYRTVGLSPKPILQAIAEDYPLASGELGWGAVHNIQALLAAARPLDIPVFYAYVAPKEESDAGRLTEKVPTMLSINRKGYEFPTEVAPQPGDVLIPKRHPSAFFGTPLTTYLIGKGIDTLLLCGCTTSGCIRATAVDAFSYNFRVGVIEECVYDRSQVSHAVNLFDMQSKYGDVITMVEALEYVRGL